MIKVRNIKKYYGETLLFKGLDLDVRQGEAVVLIGPSGSGKSTFLRCINGLETFQEGEIIINGTVTLHATKNLAPSGRDSEAVRQVRRKIGMVFQQFNLFPHMTAMENIIEAPVRVLGINKAAAEELAAALLRRINMEDKAGQYPERLSGGEQQRVAIARALAMKPGVMLFDEPTSSLDPEMIGEVLSVIRGLIHEGMTTLIATHEMDFARGIADRVIVFDKGDIIETGLPEDIFTKPKVERTRGFLSRILRKQAV